MNTSRKIGIFLLFLAIFGGGVFLARSFSQAPGSDDTGLSAASSTEDRLPPRSVEELPERLVIPKLDIDAEIIHVGVNSRGEMATPSNFTDVSWYKYGPIPGNVGSAVMAGHEDNAVSLDGVFKRLHELEIGDDVYVVHADGSRTHFQVVDEQIYPYDKGPLEKIFNSDDAARLNLITCAGEWLTSAKTNDKRLVIYTKLME